MSSHNSASFIVMDFPFERKERPIDPLSRPTAPGDQEQGPRRPKTDSPTKDNLLKRMRKVDPKQAERYRQRTGE